MKTITNPLASRPFHIPRRAGLLVIAPLLLLAVSCSLIPTTTQIEPEVGPPSQGQPVQVVTVIAPAPDVIPTPLADEAIAEIDAEEQLLINIYERVNPAVVNIDAFVDFSSGGSNLGSGSGFVIDREGHIVTNEHVVHGADELLITFSNGSVSRGTIVGVDSFADVAVIKVGLLNASIVPVELGDSDQLQVGQRVIAIGNPFGLTGSMTVGIISALGRTLADQDSPFSIPEIVQTDAAINPGNSGGPLLDSHGRVVGINTAISSESGVNSGVGFAVPVNIVRRSIEQIIATGQVTYTFLGISSNSFFSVAELALEIDLPVSQGVLIAEITPNSPADHAGLQGGNQTIGVRGRSVILGGDIITAIDGISVNDFEQLLAYLVAHTVVGDEVIITIVRDGEFFDVPVTLASRPG